MSKDAPSLPQSLLLGFLMIGPCDLAELHQEIHRGMEGVWHPELKRLSVYLDQLVESGLATIKIEVQPGHPTRSVYDITSTGQETFLTWLHHPDWHKGHVRIGYQTRLYFFHRLALPGLAQFIANEQARFRARIEAINRTFARTSGRTNQAALELRRLGVQAYSEWLAGYLEDDAE